MISTEFFRRLFISVRVYTDEERQALKNSGEPLARYALEKGIPETTLRGWVKADEELSFGAIEIKSASIGIPKSTKRATVFVLLTWFFQ